MADDEKLTTLALEVARLRGEVLELAARQHSLEARLITISEMIESEAHH